METILEVKDIKKYFRATQGPLWARRTSYAKAVDGISFSIVRGQTFALVGESGCGKTTTTKLILLIEKATDGAISFRGENVLTAEDSVIANYRTSVQAVFQDPYSSLDPRWRVGSIVSEPIWVSGSYSRQEMEERVKDSLVRVGLSPNAANLFPHEFSGGQRQRIAVARALSISPSLIILDEPVSALDVSIRAQIMNLLRDLQEQLGIGYLLIAHDLGTVRYMCHRVGIMYLGKIVEQCQGEELFNNPAHPYTRALLSAAMPFHSNGDRQEIHLPGEIPSPFDPPSGCRFHPRCPEARDVCSQQEPALVSISDDHYVACHRP